MDFNYEEETNKLTLANENMNRVINEYNSLLLSLDDKEKDVMQLYYYFQKLDTIKEMTPKGDFYDKKDPNNGKSRRDIYIDKAQELIEKLGKKIYPEITNLDELRSAVMKDMDGKLLGIIDDFRRDIKNVYKEHCESVYTVINAHGLTELTASAHRENQYLNSIKNGIFATTTMDGIQKYIGRANVEGMIVRGRRIEYPTNPFSSIERDRLTLIKPVSVYMSSVDYFEPQFDYEIDSEGRPHFIYGGEWIAPHSKVPCVERQATYLPPSFIEDNDVYYYDGGERVAILQEAKRK